MQGIEKFIDKCYNGCTKKKKLEVQGEKCYMIKIIDTCDQINEIFEEYSAWSFL